MTLMSQTEYKAQARRESFDDVIPCYASVAEGVMDDLTFGGELHYVDGLNTVEDVVDHVVEEVVSQIDAARAPRDLLDVEIEEAKHEVPIIVHEQFSDYMDESGIEPEGWE